MAAPLDRVDSEIAHALRQTLEFFQVDRCGLLEFQVDKALARVTHAECDENIEPISGEVTLPNSFRGVTGNL